MNVASALQYQDAGLAVVPVPKGQKRPLLLGWPRLAETPATADQIGQWYAADPQLGVGLVCGAGGLVVLDIDEVAPAPEWCRLLELETPTVRTHRGWHVYMDAGSSSTVSGRRLARTVELRGHGQLVIAPPSSHPSGSRYVWARGREFPKVPILELPDDLRRQLPPHTETPSASHRDTALHRGCGAVRGVELAHEVARLLAIGFPRARCPLHDDQRPSASFFVGAAGAWIFKCHACDWASSPPGLWMRAVHGVDPGLVSIVEFALWARRLDITLGRAAVRDELLPLPAGYPGNVVSYWEGYRLLVCCERAGGYLEWPLYTHDFASRWCGIPRSTARDARTRLMKDGYLQSSREWVRVGSRSARRWCPGPAAWRVGP